MSFFEKALTPLNIGVPIFRDDIARQGISCAQVDWKPIAGGDVKLIAALDSLSNRPGIDRANLQAAERIKSAHPVWVGMDHAKNVIPGMTKTTILHAGPPISYEAMCGPMKGAIMGALIYEGFAQTPEEADQVASSGSIIFSPCHEHQSVGPMAGVISASMPVHIVENTQHGNRSYATVNEGLGKVLRFGANGDEVIERLKYVESSFMPVMQKVLEICGGIDLKNITAQALNMGDECHNRNKAATALLLRELSIHFMNEEINQEEAKSALSFIRANEHYFLNLSMPACKSALASAQGIEGSTIVTVMARNGVEFGIKVAGLPENVWLTAPAQMVDGLLFPGFSADDAAPDLGDSAITETMGIGGFAMAAAPSIVQFVGGNVSDAFTFSEQMYEITETENPSYALPALDFRGAATGIDVRKVVETGVLPVINTGIAHKVAGVGQVGAGIVHPPQECFNKALLSCVKAFHNLA